MTLYHWYLPASQKRAGMYGDELMLWLDKKIWERKKEREVGGGGRQAHLSYPHPIIIWMMSSFSWSKTKGHWEGKTDTVSEQEVREVQACPGPKNVHRASLWASAGLSLILMSKAASKMAVNVTMSSYQLHSISKFIVSLFSWFCPLFSLNLHGKCHLRAVFLFGPLDFVSLSLSTLGTYSTKVMLVC